MNKSSTLHDPPAPMPAPQNAGAEPAGAGPVRISVVVPHLNQPQLLARCLASLTAQSLARDRFEILVVDNGSHDAPGAVVDACPGARLLHEPLPGPGPARNRGVGAARGALLAFLDADCTARPDWLECLLARFDAAPGLAALGGEVRVHAARPAHPNVAEAFDLVYGFRQERMIVRHGFAATANFALRRTVFDAVGPFAGIDISEDMDWGRRATRAGHRIGFAPDAVVDHPARRSMAALRAQWDRHTRHFFGMRPPGPAAGLGWAFQAGAIALSPLAEIVPILRSDRMPSLRARGLALLGVTRIRLFRARRMLALLLQPGTRRAVPIWNRD